MGNEELMAALGLTPKALVAQVMAGKAPADVSDELILWAVLNCTTRSDQVQLYEGNAVWTRYPNGPTKGPDYSFDSDPVVTTCSRREYTMVMAPVFGRHHMEAITAAYRHTPSWAIAAQWELWGNAAPAWVYRPAKRVWLS